MSQRAEDGIAASLTGLPWGDVMGHLEVVEQALERAAALTADDLATWDRIAARVHGDEFEVSIERARRLPAAHRLALVARLVHDARLMIAGDSFNPANVIKALDAAIVTAPVVDPQARRR